MHIATELLRQRSGVRRQSTPAHADGAVREARPLTHDVAVQVGRSRRRKQRGAVVLLEELEEAPFRPPAEKVGVERLAHRRDGFSLRDQMRPVGVVGHEEAKHRYPDAHDLARNALQRQIADQSPGARGRKKPQLQAALLRKELLMAKEGLEELKARERIGSGGAAIELVDLVA